MKNLAVALAALSLLSSCLTVRFGVNTPPDHYERAAAAAGRFGAAVGTPIELTGTVNKKRDQYVGGFGADFGYVAVNKVFRLYRAWYDKSERSEYYFLLNTFAGYSPRDITESRHLFYATAITESFFYSARALAIPGAPLVNMDFSSTGAGLEYRYRFLDFSARRNGASTIQWAHLALSYRYGQSMYGETAYRDSEFLFAFHHTFGFFSSSSR